MVGSIVSTLDQKWILHADMDAFYASVEQRDAPSLQGKPVAVGGDSPRGVIAAASYEARQYGVYSAMATVRAKRLCPDLVVLPPRIKHYAKISKQVFAIFAEYSPAVESLSLDEAFLDVTGMTKLFGGPETIALRVKQCVRSQLDLVVSIGLAPNKFVAKIASALGKPDGYLRVDPESVSSFLEPLSVDKIWGVGKVSSAKLQQRGIQTIGQLRQWPKTVLVSDFGKLGERLWALARGIDDRSVQTNRQPSSISQECTFAQDKSRVEQIEPVLHRQADRIAHRLRQGDYEATTIAVKLKPADFRLHTKQKRLFVPTSDGSEIAQTACALAAELFSTLREVRLVGISATGLVCGDAPRQLDLDHAHRKKRRRLGDALDQIEKRFGDGLIVRGGPKDGDG